MTDVRDKRALVTGASRGLGFLIARGLAELGADVTLWDLDARELDAAARRIGPRASWKVVDVGDVDAVRAAAAELGPVDVLVNNAGVVTGKAFLDLAPEDIERTLRVNTLAHFWTIKEFLPSMISADSGHIVTIASAAGFCSVPRLADSRHHEERAPRHHAADGGDRLPRAALPGAMVRRARVAPRRDGDDGRVRRAR